MSQDEDRKTEEPTQRRLDEARKEGTIARSSDVMTVGVLFGTGLFIWFGAFKAFDKFRELFHLSLSSPMRMAEGSASSFVLELSSKIGIYTLELSLYIMGFPVVIAILIGQIQTRGLFTPRAARFDFSRADPSKGLERLFSRHSWATLIKSSVKLILLGGILIFIVWSLLPAAIRLPLVPVAGVAELSASVLRDYFGLCLLALGLVAVADHWLQSAEHRRQLRMTPDEVKRERKDQVVDPHIAALRRSLAQSDAQNNDLSKLEDAAAVLYSAQEACAVAVALGERESVWVLAKGKHETASALLQAAKRYRVPVIRSTELSTTIFAEVEVNSMLSSKSAQRVRRSLDLQGTGHS